jgi:hypothetical protein
MGDGDGVGDGDGDRDGGGDHKNRDTGGHNVVLLWLLLLVTLHNCSSNKLPPHLLYATP